MVVYFIQMYRIELVVLGVRLGNSDAYLEVGNVGGPSRLGESEARDCAGWRIVISPQPRCFGASGTVGTPPTV